LPFFHILHFISKDMKNMEETQVELLKDMENTEENSEKIWKL
jgi:hypothetical protein